jgi:hypothetical protein
VTPPPVTPPAGPAPTITAINRHGSPVTGGEMVLIVGTNLDTADLVTFGGTPATGLQYDAANGWLVVVDPAHAEGFVDIVVRVADGQIATLPGYHYGPPPAVAAFTPETGPRGTLITITGIDVNVANGVVVELGGTICVVVSKTATELVAVAPKLNPGAYPVVVVNFDGQTGVSRTSFTMQ